MIWMGGKLLGYIVMYIYVVDTLFFSFVFLLSKMGNRSYNVYLCVIVSFEGNKSREIYLVIIMLR